MSMVWSRSGTTWNVTRPASIAIGRLLELRWSESGVLPAAAPSILTGVPDAPTMRIVTPRRGTVVAGADGSRDGSAGVVGGGAGAEGGVGSGVAVELVVRVMR